MPGLIEPPTLLARTDDVIDEVRAARRRSEHLRTDQANTHLRHCAAPDWMRKPNGHTAHSKRRGTTEVLHAGMPPNAGEAGHGPKSDTHANCGNHEKYGKDRLWAAASWALIGGYADSSDQDRF